MAIDNSKKELSARDDSRKLALLIAIDKIPSPTVNDIQAATDIPARTVHSMINALKKLDVSIVRVNGRRHGHYVIQDEGAYNVSRLPKVLEFHSPNTLQRIEQHAAQKSLLAKTTA